MARFRVSSQSRAVPRASLGPVGGAGSSVARRGHWANLEEVAFARPSRTGRYTGVRSPMPQQRLLHFLVFAKSVEELLAAGESDSVQD